MKILCNILFIIQVKFHKDKVEILTSGALDGLLNIYNILEETEDDALTFSLNVENSVERLSWMDEKRLACITQSNDLQVWNSDTGDLVKSYSRDKVARSIKVCFFSISAFQLVLIKLYNFSFL